MRFGSHLLRRDKARGAKLGAKAGLRLAGNALGLEPLEERRLLAVIIWQNRGSEGSDTDNFAALYGADAPVARSIVDRALDDWEAVIADFHYLEFGGLFEPLGPNTYSVSVDAAALAGGLGTTTITDIDVQGKPFFAAIELDDDGGGLGWFFDPTPQDDFEFNTLIAPFRADSTMTTVDFYRTIVHELGHAMGIAPNAGLALQNLLVDPGIADPNDAAADLLNFFGASLQTTLTTTGGLHLFEGPAPGGLTTPVAPNDVMNPNRATTAGERGLISDTDAKLLADAYGYTINLPSKINTLYVNLSPAGVLEVRGLPDNVNDQVVIDNNGSLRVIVNGTEEIINSAVTSISIQTFGGNDFIFVSPDVGITTSIDAGNGNDTITVGGGATTVASVTDDGNDIIDFSHNPFAVTFIAHDSDRIVGTRFNDEFVIELAGVISPATLAFDGGVGADRITLRQTSGPARTSTTVNLGANPGKGRIVIVDDRVTQTLDFENVEPIVDNIPAASFNITSVAGLASLLQGANEIDYGPGVLLPTGGRVTVDAFEPIEFENKTSLVIDAGAGRDNLTLDNVGLPTGLATIVANGGSADDVITVLNVPDASDTSFVSVTLSGGTGADRLDASAVTQLTPFTLNGGSGADTLIGGPDDDNYNADDGDDILIESRGDDRLIGGGDTDTLLVQGTLLADVILLNQTSLTTLEVHFNGDDDENAIRGVEIVRVEAGDGDDTIGVSVTDTLIVPGTPDTDSGSLAFRIVGGAPNASDRLIVRDDGEGDLVVHRQGADLRSGSIRVGPLQPVDYEGIEFVDITPLDPVTGRTGDDGDGVPNGQLIVFLPDTKESNASRLVATPLGSQPLFVPNLSIDPGVTVLPAPFGTIGGDEDWFEFRPSKTSTFRFDVLFEQIPTLPSGRQGLPADGDLQIAVYDAAGVQIAAANESGDNESLMIGMQAGQKYYLRVRGSLVELEQRVPESGINVYDLAVVEVDVLGPQVFDPDAGGPLSGVHVTDDPATAVNEAEFDLFAAKDPTLGTTPTPYIKSLTIHLRDPLTTDILLRQVGFVYPALDAVKSIQPGLFRLVGDNVGPIAIKAVILTNNPVLAGELATATIELQFFSALPDDRYTLTLLDGVVDPPGNKLDGESNASEPQSPPSFPSGNGISGGNFTARFTVDSRPEIGVYIGTTVVVDMNSNGTFDPANPDVTNRDLVFDFGAISDQRLAGKLSSLQPGFDVLIAYGRVNAGAPYRFLIDVNGNGRVDPGEEFAAPQVNGLAVAADFNLAHAGEELAIFDGTQWHILYDGVGGAVTTVATSMRGYPIAGDFNGDGLGDLGTYQNNQFFLDYAPAFGGADLTINFGMPGTADRPVAGDLDGDGIDDIGLWVPDAGAGQGTGEWRFLISSDPAGLNHAFSPAPLGRDLAFRFGDPRALPIVGNFDPPVATGTRGASAQATVTSLYHEILGRDPDPAGLSNFVSQLNSGASIETIAHTLATSSENYGQMVDELYADYFNRAADAGGRAHWIDQLVHGTPEDLVVASLLDSAEYSTLHASDAAFVDALYSDVLQRSADAGGRATQLAVLFGGQPRSRVIENLIESQERALRIGRADNLPDNTIAQPSAAMGNSQAETLVQALYQDILGRVPDAAGRALFVGQLQAGATRQSVAISLLNSREYLGHVVDGLYQDYLNRAADAAGRQYWVDRLVGGLSQDAVAAGLLGSAEYSLLHGSNDAFVTALYQDALGRSADAGGRSHFLARLQSGASRGDVIGDLLASEERSRLIVQAAYTQTLNRAADSSGLNFFSAKIRTGQLGSSTLLAELFASDEYLMHLLG